MGKTSQPPPPWEGKGGGQRGGALRDFARRPGGVPKVALVATLGILSLVTAVSNVTSVSASTGIGVFVGYADSLRADIGNFPTPWSGSPNVTFRGCLPGSCEYDAGAARIVNNSDRKSTRLNSSHSQISYAV